MPGCRWHTGGVKRVELSIEVEPIRDDVVARLKDAGYAVYQGSRTWRVVAEAPVVGRDSIRAQAHVVARQIVRTFDLEVTSDPPTIALRDPDTMIDAAGTGLILAEVRRAYDPDPLPRPKRKWYQKQMELGLGERKDP